MLSEEEYEFWLLHDDQPFPVAASFVREQVILCVGEKLADFGDGPLNDDHNGIHAREVQALLDYIQGRCLKE